MITKSKVIYPQLSYQITGILFEVQNDLGHKLQEKYYQRAVEEGLRDLKIPYQREIKVDLFFKGQKIGFYFLDFLIDDKIILELKAVPRLAKEDFRQVLSYLKSRNLELGILANFRTDKLDSHRILNTRK